VDGKVRVQPVVLTYNDHVVGFMGEPVDFETVSDGVGFDLEDTLTPVSLR